MKTAADIAGELGGESKGSDGWWHARCPAHDDDKASLGLRDTEDGGVAWTCFAGCDKRAVGIALRERGLLPELPPQEQKAKRTIVAAYDYRRPDGSPSFQTVRYRPKDFRQRRPDPDRPGKWIWNLDGIGPRPLYRLPELLAADPTDLVFLVEGEKDVDRLRSVGLIATTTAQGAKGWAKSDHSPLAGRHLIIVPDNDESGRGYAEQAGRDLVGKAASLRVLELPELPPKGDVSDWLDAGGTPQELIDLAAKAAAAPKDNRAKADPIDEIAADLAGLNRVEYDRRRKVEAKQLGIRAETLDQLVDARRAPDPGTGAGRALEWPAPDPWPRPVDGVHLLEEIAATFRRFVVLPASSDTALALWVLHAHSFEASPITPRLAIKSPEPRCGKTTTLEVVQALVPRPILASNITAAAVFRTIEVARPTLLIDEADTFLAEAEELRGVLNSGHRRSGEVIRTAGEDHEPRRFSTWAPIAIAAIGKIPGTLEDRSISIELRRRGAGETVDRWRLDRAHHLEPLVRQCARWAADHRDDLAASDPVVPAQLHDRAADNWRSLLAIADAAGGEWPARARAAAVALSGGVAAEGRREMLLADIRAVFTDLGDPDWVATTDIIKALVDMVERPWAEWSRGRPISPQGLRTLLEPFKIYSTQKRGDGSRNRGYDMDSFADAWTRYLTGSASVHPCQTQEIRGFQAETHPCRSDEVARMPNGEESSNFAASARMHGCDTPEQDDDGEEWL